MPSITSPSPGIMSPASATTTSPLRRVEAGTRSSRPFRSFRAWVSWRRPRKAAAWALPRPSASASAKFAKRTVNQSQRATCPVKIGEAAPAEGATRSRIHTSVVSTLPDLDHEHDRVADHHPRVELADAVEKCRAEERDLPTPRRLSRCARSWLRTPFRTAPRKCSTIGDRPSAGKNVSAPTITTTPTRSAEKSGPFVGSVPGPGGRSSSRRGSPRSRARGRSSGSGR